jgi:hypothetical protein
MAKILSEETITPKNNETQPLSRYYSRNQWQIASG